MRYATPQERIGMLANAGKLLDSVHAAEFVNIEGAIVYYNRDMGRPVLIAMARDPHRQVVVIGGRMPYATADMSAEALVAELDEWLGQQRPPLTEKYSQRLRSPESYASYIVMRAAYCAMDFGDTKIAAYVQDCFDACTGDDKLYEEFRQAVHEELAALGYRW